MSFFLISIIKVYTVCQFSLSEQVLHYLQFSAVWSRSRSKLSGSVWSGSTLFAILSIVVEVKVYTVILRNSSRIYTIYHSKLSDQGLHCLPFSATWSGSTLLAILSSLIKVYTVCHSQQPVQGLHYFPLSAVWSESTLFAILNSLISVYTVCQSQQSDQGTLFAILSNLIRVYTTCHSQCSHQGLHCLPFSAVWSGSTLFAILSMQYNQGLFAFPSFLIRFNTVCPS